MVYDHWGGTPIDGSMHTLGRLGYHFGQFIGRRVLVGFGTTRGILRHLPSVINEPDYIDFPIRFFQMDSVFKE